jgi:Protein of unknown function (DUF3800)
VPFPARSYIAYVDDSGNENVGWMWTAVALPFDPWSEYLRRWLAFRHWLYRRHGVPANFELHAQVWLTVEPAKHTGSAGQLALVKGDDGGLIEILGRGRERRRARFEVFEKGLKTIGTFTDARLFTVGSPIATGAAKLALYDELLCFVEDFLAREGSHATVIVDGAHDSGGHLRAAHRALLIKHRRIVEDAGLRRSADSQLLQVADCCAHAAFQSVQNKASLDEKFRRRYETTLSRLIVRPFGVEEGRCIRGLDYAGDTANCPSERIGTRPQNTSPGLPGLV